ncbi:MAG TPA: glycine/betaine ABC transporter ATP-binding protein, partial [Pantoea sp.]|nr:glycine/betaine ABC transporter ATP-binding protein [Pantoea sp.]
CGKTTTLKMINRLIPSTSGKIYINGEDTSTQDTVTLRRNIGYVIQQIGLFPNMTIEENITVVPRMLGWDKKRCRERATELMSMVALDPAKFLHRYPREMSGGQQQRIGVIRALAADPQLLLLDEPTAFLDPETEADLLRTLAAFARGRSVVIATHSETAMRWADTRLTLTAGGARLATEASP